MEGDRLALSVTSASGTQVRWGGDEPDSEMIPADLEFGTAMPGGYKDLQCSLLRRLGGSESLFNRVRVYGPGNRTAWDGRLIQFPRQDLQISPGAVGWSSHMRDDPSFREIYVDRDLTHWIQQSVQDALTSSSTWDDSFKHAILTDQVTNQPALKTAIQGDWTGRRPRCETWYDSSHIPIGSFSYAWKINGNVSAADTNWVWRVWLSTDDIGSTLDGGTSLRAAGPGTGTLTATANNRLWALVQFFYDTVPSTGHQSIEYAAFWTILAMYGTHGLTQQGSLTATNAPGFYGHDLINDIVTRTCPLLQAGIGPGKIETNITFVVPQATFLDPTTAEDAVLLLNSYFLNEWGVYDDKQFFWRPPDPNRLTWTVRKDEGASINEEGPTADAQYNGVIVRFSDPTGQRRIAGPPAAYWQGGFARCEVTNAALVDTNTANAVNAAGIPRRWGVLDIGPVTTDTGAVQLGSVWLAEHSLPQRRGTITVRGQATHPTEGPVPPWRIRAGDGIIIGDTAGDASRRIVETRYTRGDDTLTATVGNSDYKLDAILERIGVQLVGVL